MIWLHKYSYHYCCSFPICNFCSILFSDKDIDLQIPSSLWNYYFRLYPVHFILLLYFYILLGMYIFFVLIGCFFLFKRIFLVTTFNFIHESGFVFDILCNPDSVIFFQLLFLLIFFQFDLRTKHLPYGSLLFYQFFKPQNARAVRTKYILIFCLFYQIKCIRYVHL